MEKIDEAVSVCNLCIAMTLIMKCSYRAGVSTTVLTAKLPHGDNDRLGPFCRLPAASPGGG